PTPFMRRVRPSVVGIASTRAMKERTLRGTRGPGAGGPRGRYGSDIGVPSPDAEITKVPAAVLPAYTYGVVHPDGGVGSDAMNGRSEERRVGKEGGDRGSTERWKKKKGAEEIAARQAMGREQGCDVQDEAG